MNRVSLRHLVAVLLCLAWLGPTGNAHALDGESSGVPSMSMDEVARQIRQIKGWQILEAQSRKKDSGSQYFRFKLLRSDGKVKVINIDPNNPNLRRLEQ